MLRDTDTLNQWRTNVLDSEDQERLDLPVRVVDVGPDHLHGPLSDSTGADVPPQPQVQDQPQGTGQWTGEHHANLSQPGQTRCQLEAVTRTQDVRAQLSQEEDEEGAGEDRWDDGAQGLEEKDTKHRVSQSAQEEQGTRLKSDQRRTIKNIEFWIWWKKRLSFFFLNKVLFRIR